MIPVIEIIERIIWKLPVGAKNKDLSRVIFDDRKRADTKMSESFSCHELKMYSILICTTKMILF